MSVGSVTLHWLIYAIIIFNNELNKQRKLT